MLEGKDWQLPSGAFFLCTVWVNSLLNWGSRYDGGAQSCFGQPEDELKIQRCCQRTVLIMLRLFNPRMGHSFKSWTGLSLYEMKGMVSSELNGSSNILWLKIIFSICTMMLTFRGKKGALQRQSLQMEGTD